MSNIMLLQTSPIWITLRAEANGVAVPGNGEAFMLASLYTFAHTRAPIGGAVDGSSVPKRRRLRR
jgi:hypothetical protein